MKVNDRSETTEESVLSETQFSLNWRTVVLPPWTFRNC